MFPTELFSLDFLEKIQGILTTVSFRVFIYVRLLESMIFMTSFHEFVQAYCSLVLNFRSKHLTLDYQADVIKTLDSKDCTAVCVSLVATILSLEVRTDCSENSPCLWIENLWND